MQQLLTIDRLTDLCASITAINSRQGNHGEIYSVWGGFTIRRDEIETGVRFSLLDCPHAFTWSVTFEEDRKHIVIHCTINRKEEYPRFIESISDFVDE